jgi:hypothetical protein
MPLKNRAFNAAETEKEKCLWDIANMCKELGRHLKNKETDASTIGETRS